ncbi:unnamed protein product [Rotaria socialis]|uniref:F-box domain-containing protein n=1 Tax=Rotaria socialis TaxID=392032 RepID=A0A818Y8V0_9BILA|nr:unnamed protein product [Rotaria socialis]CAF3752753.1 unnamed protein product [Rotaria socialis]CAF4719124.1 unnamed protein product [Rotaria socialis]CAF4807773.1 unnamed protein product [Rotaria socialis]
MFITTIENLSNELFYEIFDYLDGCNIYQAFLNLNYRFQQLLHASALHFKITIPSSDETDEEDYEQLLHINKQQILSLTVTLYSSEDNLFSLYPINLFTCLESLSLSSIQSEILISILTDLTYSTHLRSLTIDIDTQSPSSNLNEIYRLIFTLPQLKYVSCSSDSTIRSKLLSVATKKQLTTIEHLVIDHNCTFSQLSIIISYTPKLRYLHISSLDENNYSSETILPINLFNLTHLSIKSCEITFHDLKFFITETKCNLKVLHIDYIQFYDPHYVDDNRWESLISECLPELKKIYLNCYQEIDTEPDSLACCEPRHSFTSLFWIERQWALDVEMNSFDIVYSIGLYKDRWYDKKSSNELSKFTRFIITDVLDDVLDFIFLGILMVTQIFHLEIRKHTMCSNTLIQILDYLSELDSLRISSFILSESKLLSFTSTKSIITKVYLENMNSIEEIDFIMQICPRLTYLKIDLTNKIDYESFFKYILQNSHQCLQLICLHLPTTINNELVNKLHNHKKLIQHYTIELEDDNIYLHRK